MTDLCVSRPKSRLNWGIEVPFDRDHVTYVWFDALVNYISAMGFVNDNAKFDRFWPADIHMMAKDIIRQHAIYWPIMLKAAGLAMPKQIVAHGWWKMGEIKMSKSLGNVVDPVEMAEKYGVDAFRYFLMRDVPFGGDGNFSTDSFEKRFNGDLANDLGNLVHRTANMILKYANGKISQGVRLVWPADIDSPILEKFVAQGGQASDLISQLAFNLYLEEIWDLIGAANKFVEQVKPWNLKKESKQDDVINFLGIMVAVLKFSAQAIAPVMPSTAQKIKQQFSGDVIQIGEPLFPRLEK